MLVQEFRTQFRNESFACSIDEVEHLSEGIELAVIRIWHIQAIIRFRYGTQCRIEMSEHVKCGWILRSGEEFAQVGVVARIHREQEIDVVEPLCGDLSNNMVERDVALFEDTQTAVIGAIAHVPATRPCGVNPNELTQARPCQALGKNALTDR